jgi:hypothetical protein
VPSKIKLKRQPCQQKRKAPLIQARVQRLFPQPSHLLQLEGKEMVIRVLRLFLLLHLPQVAILDLADQFLHQLIRLRQ